MSLISSEERFYRLIENSRDVIYRINLAENKFDYINKSVKEITGYNAYEFYSDINLIYQIIHPDYFEFFKQENEKIRNGKVSSTYEFKIISKDGKTKWMFQKNLLIFNNNLNPVAVEATITEITGYKELQNTLQIRNEEIFSQNEELNSANEEISSHLKELEKVNDKLILVYNDLQTSENEYRSLIENVPCIVYRIFFEKEKKIMFYNDMVNTITGYDNSEILENDIDLIKKLIIEEDYPEVITQIKAAIEGKKTYRLIGIGV